MKIYCKEEITVQMFYGLSFGNDPELRTIVSSVTEEFLAKLGTVLCEGPLNHVASGNDSLYFMFVVFIIFCGGSENTWESESALD